MNTRKFDFDSDYEKIISWWTAWEWPIIPIDHLPAIGTTVEEHNVPLAAGFLYQTDSQFSWMEWITGNPDIEKSLRREALDILIEELSARAKQERFTTIFTTMRHPSLITRSQDHGFRVTDVGMTNLVKRI